MRNNLINSINAPNTAASSQSRHLIGLSTKFTELSNDTKRRKTLVVSTEHSRGCRVCVPPLCIPLSYIVDPSDHPFFVVLFQSPNMIQAPLPETQGPTLPQYSSQQRRSRLHCVLYLAICCSCLFLPAPTNLNLSSHVLNSVLNLIAGSHSCLLSRVCSRGLAGMMVPSPAIHVADALISCR